MIRIIQYAAGDARKALNLLESAVLSAEPHGKNIHLNTQGLEEILKNNAHKIDKGGDYFYDQLSAFHKSIRGSDPDAAIFWLVNMIESGIDPNTLARRMTCIASEDIGNADPKALTLALNAWQAFERLGLPEGRLALAQAATYLASAPKSNRSYLAYQKASEDLKKHTNIQVPLHLRNIQPLGEEKKAPYLYPHDFENAYVNQQYRPDGINHYYYEPSNRGLEAKIPQRLHALRALKQRKS